MDYKEKYEQGLECIQEILSSGQEKIKMTLLKERLQPFFPELKESEDERIREEIIDFLWKEKIFLQEAHSSVENNPKYRFVMDAIAWLEKQGEKKPTDKVEPKFKVGDWIVQENIGVYKIIEVCESWYEVISYINGRQYSIAFDYEYMCHLWTIEDAKDGDVLVASDSSLFIFAKVKDNSAYYYFSLCKNGSKEISDGNRAWETANSCHPATKEQRDLLFQEIRKAGYEWDAEKKELNKITFKVGDWLQYRNAKPFFVEEITKQGYVNGNSCLPFNWENEIHLWTIDDAKDGDVLACNEEILLFKSYSVQGRISVYCWYNWKTNNFHSIGVDDASLTKRNKIYPATKEQHDLLFQKMKDAGYQWDAEKKELKKIHVIDEGKAEMDYCFTKMMNGEKVSSTWSKEDEEILKNLIDYFSLDDGLRLPTEETIDWLKSLKERLL